MDEKNQEQLRQIIWEYFGNKTDLVLAKAFSDLATSGLTGMDLKKKQEFLEYLLTQVFAGVVSESKLGYFEFKLRKILEMDEFDVGQAAKEALMRD